MLGENRLQFNLLLKTLSIHYCNSIHKMCHTIVRLKAMVMDQVQWHGISNSISVFSFFQTSISRFMKNAAVAMSISSWGIGKHDQREVWNYLLRKRFALSFNEAAFSVFYSFVGSTKDFRKQGYDSVKTCGHTRHCGMRIPFIYTLTLSMRIKISIYLMVYSFPHHMYHGENKNCLVHRCQRIEHMLVLVTSIPTYCASHLDSTSGIDVRKTPVTARVASFPAMQLVSIVDFLWVWEWRTQSSQLETATYSI